jgi:hypothetical protein
MSALAWGELTVSHNVLSEKSSVKMGCPMPGFISGVAVVVDRTSSVGVAEAGNQIMVEVGSGVSVRRGGSAAGSGLRGRQAFRSGNPKRSIEINIRRIK